MEVEIPTNATIVFPAQRQWLTADRLAVVAQSFPVFLRIMPV
jgi:hypothetical protein